MRRLIIYSLIVFLFSVAPVWAEYNLIASNGVSSKTIAIPSTASVGLQTTAAELAGFLNRITGGTFAIVNFDIAVGPPSNSIVLGLGCDLNLNDEVPPPGGNLKTREDYLICSANNRSYIVLVGTTDLAVSNAVYDFLERLNCRWYFPSSHWEIIPNSPTLYWITAPLLRSKTVMMGQTSMSLSVYHDESPSYKSRNIWFGYYARNGGNPSGEWMQPYNDYVAWSKRNRNNYRILDVTLTGLDIKATHNYSKIVTWAKAKGLWNPDYYSLIGGVRSTNTAAQLCIGNPAVQQLVKDYAVDYFITNPNADCVSLEPNDDTLWCECAACQAIQDLASGSITNRVVTLANAAASAVKAAHPGKLVGMLAYSKHLAPPTIPLQDNIYVQITTGYLSGGWYVDTLLEAWSAYASNLGIYDYYSNFIYDNNLPAMSDISNLSYVQEDIPFWHTQKVDNLSAESTYGFGPNGLGYYLSNKIAWNVGINGDPIITDFLTQCFGPASEVMRDFYEHINKGNGHRFSRSLLRYLYSDLQEARAMVTDSAILGRLDDLGLWLRYCELQYNFMIIGAASPTTTPARQAAAEGLLRFCWKIRLSTMMDSLTLWRALISASFNPDLAWPLDSNGNPMNYATPQGIHPWKEAGTYTTAEVDQMIADGLANNPPLPETLRNFTGDLVPSAKSPATRGNFTGFMTGLTGFYLRSDANGQLPLINFSNGWSIPSKGDAEWTLYSVDGSTALETGKVPPDKLTYQVSFVIVEPNKNYFLEYDDHSAASKITWATGAQVCIRADGAYPHKQNGGVSRRYFYVPYGTRYIIAYAKGISPCGFYNAAGQLKYTQQSITTAGLDIVVPVGNDDGQIWYMGGQGYTFWGDTFFFRNVPGLLAMSPDELLIPKDAFTLLPSGAAPSTRGVLTYMTNQTAFYIRGDANGVLPVMNISTGWQYQNKGDSVWKLYTEGGGVELESGTIPPDQITRSLTFATTGTNTFLLVYNDNTSSSKVSWDAGKFVSISANQTYPLGRQGGIVTRYFFVPKGTKNIQFHADTILPTTFYTANGTPRYSQPVVSTGGVDADFPVEPGDDDQIWYMTGLSGVGFYFKNIPGHIAANTDELLIPEWTLID